MAPIADVRVEIVLDTSWLIELYGLPSHSQASRTENARSEIVKIVERRQRMWVTVPVLFEMANHIVRVPDGHVRRDLSTRFSRDVESSIERDLPWTIPAVDKDVLLRPRDILRLADQLLQQSGPNYSFADISIIDLAEQFHKKDLKVKILAFDEQLEAYSD